MDVDTKARAKDKANKMKDKYGFPPYLLNNTKIISEYEGLALEDGDDFWGYTWTINEWAIKNHNMKLRKPVDKVSSNRIQNRRYTKFKELWSMSVQETNAYYSPTENAMVFPAGILQPPLYHIDYPSYFNYGAIGKFSKERLEDDLRKPLFSSCFNEHLRNDYWSRNHPWFR